VIEKNLSFNYNLDCFQEVSLVENSSKQQTIRKATSVPNIANQPGMNVRKARGFYFF